MGQVSPAAEIEWGLPGTLTGERDLRIVWSGGGSTDFD